ncbi:MAG: hypothetical protein F6K39_19400 [Okeania sp. SIO3B3]|nr:hypothetical protein [Okeania sp. SIO3B3]
MNLDCHIDDGDPTWMDAIKSETEKLEGFVVEHDEMVLKVYHWGTDVGSCYHYGSYLDVTPTLINELAKYDLDLEAFMVDNDIYYQLIKSKSIKHPQVRPDLHLSIQWSKDLWPNDGYINGHYFCYHRNDYHGYYIQLVYRNQIYHSNWSHSPDYLKPYFDAIWKEIQEGGIFRHPKEISLGSKVASCLPDGYKVYMVNTDCNSQCRIQKSVKEYCYLKHWRDSEYYVSASENFDLAPREIASNLRESVKIALKMISNQQRC